MNTETLLDWNKLRSEVIDRLREEMPDAEFVAHTLIQVYGGAQAHG